MMAVCFSIVGGNAKVGEEQTRESLRDRRNYSRANFLVLNKFRELHPVKTAVYLSEATGFPIRTCEYWLSNETLPSDAIWTLLQSRHGLEILAVAMHDARPEWWKRLLRVGLIASVMRRRETDLRLLEQTLGADRELTIAIARATSLSEDEFHRPYVAALDDQQVHGAHAAGSRVQHRPMDASGKGSRVR